MVSRYFSYHLLKVFASILIDLISYMLSNEMGCFPFIATSMFLFVFFNLVECGESDPLILTPLLEAGKYQEAQDKARVVPDIQGVKSYAGYFTVNKECENNLFFWFTPAEKNWESASVLLWLNGGPGCTSLFGMFREIGPFDYVKKKGFVRKEHHWSRDHSVVYLDQPVGTGFSFTRKDCYVKNLTSLAQEAYKAVVQFFMLFPNLQKNSFFITGESYGVHSISALAVEIDGQNRNSKLKINMVGVMIGNPTLDYRCEKFSEFLYQLGVVDENNRDLFVERERILTQEINNKDYKKAIEAYYDVFFNMSLLELPSYYNVLYDKSELNFFQFYLRSYQTRKMIHVGQTPYFTCSDPVYEFLEEDIYTPVGGNLQKLLQSNKYTVGIYSGQLDLLCLYTSVPCVLRQLKWSGAADYLAANRSQWFVGDRLAGWYKTAGNLFEVVVRNSGHYVPTDQPEAALDLLKAFVADRPGTRLLTKLKTEK